MGMDFYKKEADEPRSPWVSAGIGAGGGGLLAAALGYIYGHRGKWLAYDTLTGGLAGGAAGYAIEQSNKNRIENGPKEGPETDYAHNPVGVSAGARMKIDRDYDAANKERMKGLEKFGNWKDALLAGYKGQTAHPGSRSAEYTRDEIKSLVEYTNMSPDTARKIVEWSPFHALGRGIASIMDTVRGPKRADPFRDEDAQLASAGKKYENGRIVNLRPGEHSLVNPDSKHERFKKAFAARLKAERAKAAEEKMKFWMQDPEEIRNPRLARNK